MLIRTYGLNITGDGTYNVPISNNGWVANNTTVAITLLFANGTSVDLSANQSHNWNSNANPYEQFQIIVSGMSTGWVGLCYSV